MKQREIKFKAFDLINKAWCVVYTNADCMKNLDNPNCAVVEYTGLKDKNGKEIYEGDVVKVSPDAGETWDIGIVGYGSYAAFLVELPNVGTGIKSPLLNFCMGTMGCAGADIYIEIIGNIHENPELLKTDEQ